MFKKIVFSAAAAGLLAGLIVSAVQSIWMIPLILKAEKYEAATTAASMTVSPATFYGKKITTPSAETSRTALTTLSNVIIAIGFAFLLIAGFAVKGEVDWHKGTFWGIGGFVAFSLAPSLGLPPELPGTFAAPISARQLWWLLTALLTAGGLALSAFSPGWGWKTLGAALIAVPHVLGAPYSAKHGGLSPEALIHQFTAASIPTSMIFWILLGGLSGFFFHHFENV